MPSNPRVFLVACVLAIACNHKAATRDDKAKQDSVDITPPQQTATTTSTTKPWVADATIHHAIVGTSPVRGKNTALVTLVEFSDFECPFCERAERTLVDLTTKYGDDLRLVWKNNPMPFHKRARPDARLALEARKEQGDDGFWKVEHLLFTLRSTTLTDDDLLSVARTAALDEAGVKRALEREMYSVIIDSDVALAQKIGATAAPYFYVNGRLVAGAQPKKTFEAIIDDELAKAKARVAKGTAPEKVYDAIMAEAVD